MSDPFDLERFVTAQAGHHERAVAELAAGAKCTHWIWFVLPQLAALGRSERARFYGIASLAEARAYAVHPILGPRLAAAVEATLASDERDAHRLFGSPDDKKFQSCLTLFRAADPGRPVFAQALDAFYDGVPDPQTLHLIAQDAPNAVEAPVGGEVRDGGRAAGSG